MNLELRIMNGVLPIIHDSYFIILVCGFKDQCLLRFYRTSYAGFTTS